MKAVKDELDTHKRDLGLETVTFGDGDRRNNEPLGACYVGPGNAGTAHLRGSRRKRTATYTVSVQPIVIFQAYHEEDAHQPVIECLERMANVLDNAGPLGEAQDLEFPTPFTPGPILGSAGNYEVSGALEVQYIKHLDRERSTGDDV